MIAANTNRHRTLLTAAAAVFPDLAARLAPLHTEAGLLAMAGAYMRRILAGERLLSDAPALDGLADSTSALFLLGQLVAEGVGPEADQPLPDEFELPLSISALARTHGVSRKHVLKILVRAEADGLVERRGVAGDRIAGLGRLMAESSWFAGAALVATYASAQTALAVLGLIGEV
jgi:hypothetical protein